MIEIEPGIIIGPGIIMGDVNVFAVQFVSENGVDPLVSETGDNFIEE